MNPWAQLVAAFGELCRLQRAEEGASFLNCHSDENYIPSLLAKAGLDNETDCVGGLTYSEWSVSQYGDAYPRYFLPSEISGDFIEHLRSFISFLSQPILPLCRVHSSLS